MLVLVYKDSEDRLWAMLEVKAAILNPPNQPVFDVSISVVGQPPHGQLCPWPVVFFFEFLALKVSLSVLGRTPDRRRSIYVQCGYTQKLSGPEHSFYMEV